ncbi:5-methylcytosine-specific restriction endonuclease McrA [Lysobacter niastensis]|uniref:5-methylcytosine-specific restriction endonuclease McrA n=1 Tax=Lysobacter niastensis TaxID=380629 RepID=A0ABU1WEY2_9GAMM|nr:5-methylcytosine-specific restriction endonuclease McrA [Lysobacter niastensis]
MSKKQLTRNRAETYRAQSGLCHYCGVPMWEEDADAFAARYGLSPRAVFLFRCTAEHLLARCDGGRHALGNIVAACWHCNTIRHRGKHPPSSERYLERVQPKARSGEWLTVRLLANSSFRPEA